LHRGPPLTPSPRLGMPDRSRVLKYYICQEN